MIREITRVLCTVLTIVVLSVVLSSQTVQADPAPLNESTP